MLMGASPDKSHSPDDSFSSHQDEEDMYQPHSPDESEEEEEEEEDGYAYQPHSPQDSEEENSEEYQSDQPSHRVMIADDWLEGFERREVLGCGDFSEVNNAHTLCPYLTHPQQLALLTCLLSLYVTLKPLVQVYRAVDQSASEAYKVLTNSVLNDSSSAAGWSCSVAVKVVCKQDIEPLNIEREVDILTKCAHPSILLLIKHIQTVSHHFIISELLSGGHLEDRVRSQGPYPMEEAQQVAKQLCSAVSCMHELGVVHLSIRPEHVLLESFDDHVSVRLTGFGSARHASELDGYSPRIDITVCLTPPLNVSNNPLLFFCFLFSVKSISNI